MNPMKNQSIVLAIRLNGPRLVPPAGHAPSWNVIPVDRLMASERQR